MISNKIVCEEDDNNLKAIIADTNIHSCNSR